MTFEVIPDLCCLTCCWAGPVDEDGLVECHRYPPEVYVVEGRPVQYRPRMDPSDRCGEHGTYGEDG